MLVTKDDDFVLRHPPRPSLTHAKYTVIFSLVVAYPLVGKRARFAFSLEALCREVAKR